MIKRAPAASPEPSTKENVMKATGMHHLAIVSAIVLSFSISFAVAARMTFSMGC
jgi:hypothetical protein